MKTISVENQLLRIVCSVFDAYSAVLFLPEDGVEGATLASFFSLGDRIISGASIAPGKGLVGWIVRNRKPMLVDNVEQRPGVLGYYRDEDAGAIKAFMGVPVGSGGALCVDSKRQYSFSDKDCKLLQLFAEMAASSQVQQSREQLAGSIPRYFAELDVVRELRFQVRGWAAYIKRYLEILSSASEFDYCAFATFEDAETFAVEGESRPLLILDGEPVVLPMGGNLAGCVFRTEEPVIQEHLEEQSLFGRIPDMPRFRSVICMPVRVDRSTRAVVCLGSTEQREVDEPLRSFVHQCVDILALHVENLYLKSRLRRLTPKAHIPAPASPAAMHEEGPQ